MHNHANKLNKRVLDTGFSYNSNITGAWFVKHFRQSIQDILSDRPYHEAFLRGTLKGVLFRELSRGTLRGTLMAHSYGALLRGTMEGPTLRKKTKRIQANQTPRKGQKYGKRK